MALYTINEAEFDLPDDWIDKTTNIFAAGGKQPPALGFVITREPLDESRDLVEFVEEKLDDITPQLKDFKIREQRQIEVSGGLALDLEFTWRSDAGLMHQRQTYVPCGRVLLILTATARRELRPEHRTQIEGILASFKLRG